MNGTAVTTPSWPGTLANVAGCPAGQLASPTTTGADAVATAGEAFLRRYFTEAGLSGLEQRLVQMRREVAETGTWWQTTDELTFGARVAWRNAERCIGRARWSTLAVRDLRELSTPVQIRDELVRHLDLSTNGGAIRSVISVFAPDAPTTPPVRIWNAQLIRYAGWTESPGGGAVTGDPDQAPFTDLVQHLGWHGPPIRTAFDVLPWVIQSSDHTTPGLFPVPAESVLEVDLHHPEHRWFARLGLRWPALPAISNLTLQVGGVSYSCAPFSGHYMASEIAARNLADQHRYDQLPAVARGLRLDTRHDALWRDKSLIVLHDAVLHSFRAAGVRISDHHRESRGFSQFAAREEAAGRPVFGDWTWLNSYPMTPQDPSWGRYYTMPGPQDPGLHLSTMAAALARGTNPAARLPWAVTEPPDSPQPTHEGPRQP
ncbi:nitric oxide synthase oxygenase [Micromonospora sp. NPDC006766]|uniref:nitric oxide synthase oxygenase n=1 Tax=Micromonospora sp. NPDC006766 TaxID=3154778 RepID=UPI003404EDB9